MTARLESDIALGLSEAEAEHRLARHGRNALDPEHVEPWWKEVLEALTEPLVLLLIGVGALYALFGQLEDAITIGVVILAVAGVETFTELRARRAISALTALAEPNATVIRSGAPRTVPTSHLVPGDLVALEAGRRVPADLRLVRATALRMDESTVTGESVPVSKDADVVLAPDTALGDRANVALAGTLVAAGRGSGIVTATGAATELGRTAALVRGARPPRTPLQLQLRSLSHALLWAAVAASVLVPALAVLLVGTGWRDALLGGLTLAFATIPEELPILITVVLGRGGLRLAHEHAIPRRLEAAETLGSVTVICTDKTGTITENRMRVRAVVSGEELQHDADASLGHGHDAAARPDTAADGMESATAGAARVLPFEASLSPAAAHALATASIVASTQAVAAPAPATRPLGDPIDVALVDAARAAGVLPLFAAHGDTAPAGAVQAGASLTSDDGESGNVVRILADHPFDTAGRTAAALYESARGERWLAVTGAPEAVLERSLAVLSFPAHVRGSGVALGADEAMGRGTPRPLDDVARRAVGRTAARLAATGARVIAVAERREPAPAPGLDAATAEHAHSEAARAEVECTEVALTLLGLIALDDPPRPEVPAAVAALRSAGVRVMMLTGDHPATARAIAREVGMEVGRVATGADVDAASDDALRALVRDTSIVARVTPAEKLRVVRALQDNGEVVAVTGDGVNDGPALRQAAIGIAMGKRGSDLAREAADLVLTDDNFATVASAVRTGRVLHDNLRKAVRFYLAVKWGLVLGALASVLGGWPVPFTPVQIIVLELFMDLGASTAFVAEPAETDVMHRPPRAAGRPFLDRAMVTGILGGGSSLALTVLVSYGWAIARGLSPAAAHSAAFAAWMVGHLVLAAAMRHWGAPTARVGFRVSRPFALWALATAALLGAAALVPPVAARLDLTVLPGNAWAVIVTAALFLPSLWAAYWWKWGQRRGA